MPLPLVVDKIDAVPEPVRGEYTEKDGKFYLGVIPGGGLEVADVSKLKSALQAERKAKSDYETRLKDFDGLDAAKAREALETLSQLGDIKELKSLDEKLAARERQLTEKFEADRKALEKKFAGERDALGKTVETLTGQLANTMIESSASKAIADAKGSVELLLPIIKSSTRVRRDEKTGRVFVEIVDGNGEPRPSPAAGSTDNMTIKEFVEELRNNPSYARAFDGTNSTGGGATGSTGGAGSGNGVFRLTEAEARDPQKYRAAKERAVKAGQRLEIV